MKWVKASEYLQVLEGKSVLDLNISAGIAVFLAWGE